MFQSHVNGLWLNHASHHGDHHDCRTQTVMTTSYTVLRGKPWQTVATHEIAPRRVEEHESDDRPCKVLRQRHASHGHHPGTQRSPWHDAGQAHVAEHEGNRGDRVPAMCRGQGIHRESGSRHSSSREGRDGKADTKSPTGQSHEPCTLMLVGQASESVERDAEPQDGRRSRGRFAKHDAFGGRAELAVTDSPPCETLARLRVDPRRRVENDACSG